MLGVVQHCRLTMRRMRASVGSNDVIDDVITAMQTHSAMMQRCRHRWLRGSSKPCCKNCAENQRRIAAYSGITAVLSAMRNHRAVAAVQEQACRALWNIAAGNAENACIDWIERRHHRCDHGDADSQRCCSGAGTLLAGR